MNRPYRSNKTESIAHGFGTLFIFEIACSVFSIEVCGSLNPFRQNKITGKMALLKTGAKAPDFTSVDQDGKSVALSLFKGKKVVLYFYPKDDTPGCTKEACAFRDNFPKFEKLGVVVLGVSIDDEKKHKKFAEKYSLPFRLVVDAEKKIVQDYGVWGMKKFMGREYMGTNRVTYLIDENGVIEAVFPKVKPETHAEELLERLKK
jgi:peroxiredoxin Q/BCP